MEIKTKYSLGQMVWFMLWDTICSGIIREVKVRAHHRGFCDESYSVLLTTCGAQGTFDKPVETTFVASKLFSTKEDVLKHLTEICSNM